MYDYSLEKLAILKVKLQNDLLFFTRFFFKILKNSKFIVNWHHKEITKELQNVAAYQYELLNINIPPRHSKTELAGVNFIAWSLCKNPAANFLYITACDELRSETSVRIRDIITHELYDRLFNIKLKKDQQGRNLWRTNKGGGLKTATIFGQITGFGAGQMIDNELLDYIRKFEGAIILDDINKIIDAVTSSKDNKKANKIILNTILSRKNSQDTPIINIQQRAGKNDATSTLINHFQHSEKVKNLILPVLINDAPLWPFKESLESINRLKNDPETKYTFNSQYMQRPKEVEGLLFPEKSLKRFTMDILKGVEMAERIAYIDTADEGDDFYSMPIIQMTTQGAYLIDVIFNKNKLTINEPLTIQKIIDLKIDTVVIETNKEGSLYINNIREKCEKAYIRGIKNTTKKVTRIINQAGFILKNIHFRSDIKQNSEYFQFLENLTEYDITGQSKHDDAPDSLAGIAKAMRVFY